MGHLLRRLAVVAVLVAVASPLLAFDGPPQGSGEAKKEPAKGGEGAGAAPAAKDAKDDKAAANTQRLLDAGIAAYTAGKEDQAIRAFDTMIRNGGLSSQQMARVLYYRGLANRKKGRPAQAISDLTSAIWLKDGLDAAEKQEAMTNRVTAYREAGVGDVPEAAAPAGVAAAAPANGSDGWQTAMSGSASAPAGSALPTAPVSAPQNVTYEPARPPPPPPPAASSSSSGGFFSSITNMFGGSSSSGNSNSGGVATTASIAESPAAAPAAWSQTTQVATAPPPPPAPAAAAPAPEPPPQAAAPPPASFATETQVAAVAPPAAAPPPQATSAPSGSVHLQVAAVRSRDEAYALAVRLTSQYGSQLGPRRPQVDQTVIGSMGTFYRVRVGPFASAHDSEPLCGAIRSSGFDCLVITQ